MILLLPRVFCNSISCITDIAESAIDTNKFVTGPSKIFPPSSSSVACTKFLLKKLNNIKNKTIIINFLKILLLSKTLKLSSLYLHILQHNYSYKNFFLQYITNFHFCTLNCILIFILFLVKLI